MGLAHGGVKGTLRSAEMAPGIVDQGCRHHNPQPIEEDKVEPEVQRVTCRRVGQPCPQLRQEVQHNPIQLAWGGVGEEGVGPGCLDAQIPLSPPPSFCSNPSLVPPGEPKHLGSQCPQV